MALIKRTQYFVDPKVQGALMLRVVMYWLLCLFTMSLMLLCWRMLFGPARFFTTQLDDMWFHYGPAVVASLLLLPLVMVDCVRMSNRFAGPMFRLRRSMRQLAHGESVKPIQFRKGDFWCDFAEEFNSLAARLQRLEATQSAEASATEAEPAGHATR